MAIDILPARSSSAREPPINLTGPIYNPVQIHLQYLPDDSNLHEGSRSTGMTIDYAAFLITRYAQAEPIFLRSN